jgi:hypothetical protein
MEQRDLIEIAAQRTGEPAMRVLATGALPDRHIVRSNGAHLLGALLCGQLLGGTYVGSGVDESRVDCIACLDAYAETLRAHYGLPPLVNGDAGLRG